MKYEPMHFFIFSFSLREQHRFAINESATKRTPRNGFFAPLFC